MTRAQIIQAALGLIGMAKDNEHTPEEILEPLVGVIYSEEDAAKIRAVIRESMI